MTVSVIIITLNRPDCVRTCLEHLALQAPRPEQVIVVDASPGEETARVVAAFPHVLYLRNRTGFGRMTTSRNIGLLQATGEIIAFLDDDAFAHAGWLAALLEAYDAPDVGAVGGRALNNQPNEAAIGVDRIGRLMPNGTLEGNFAADPGRTLEVDHLMGCNMSFRREVLAQLGGFREDYPGISGVREDSDMCLRVRRAGFRLRFAPLAVATHIGAPQARGKRFDVRYAFYASHNHMVLIIRNYGLFSALLLRYSLWIFIFALGDFFSRLASLRFAPACVRLAANSFGTWLGVLSGIRILLTTGRDPVRHDPDASALRAHLSATGKRSLPRELAVDQHQRN